MKSPAATLMLMSMWLGGCITMTNVPRARAPEIGDSEAIVVMGMHQRYRVHLQRGRVKDGVWHMPGFSSPDANLYPEGGYIVVKVPAPKADESFSVPMVLPDGISLTSKSYVPCAGNAAPVFTPKAGSVTYIGHISYDFLDEAEPYKLSWDEAAALAFLAENYPQLPKTVHAAPMTSMKVMGTECRMQIIIPIFVPR